MKQIWKYLLLIVLTWMLLPIQLASAHTVETDGDIGAVLHIEPEDEPVAGKETIFNFVLRDKAQNFSLEHCDCVVTISENEKQIASSPLKKDLTVQATFPHKGVYDVQLRGKPQEDDLFQPFTLTWDVHVDKAVEKQTAPVQEKTTDNKLVLFLSSAAIVLSLFSLGLQLSKKK